MIDYYDRDGNEITLGRWMELFEPEYQVIAKTLTGAGEVSTVWLGINHRFMEDGPPLIFETMVFNDRQIDTGEEMHRYSTEEEALHGHLRVVERLGGPVVNVAS